MLAAELAHLQHHRHPSKPPEQMRRTLVGLALSGGGIRSGDDESRCAPGARRAANPAVRRLSQHRLGWGLHRQLSLDATLPQRHASVGRHRPNVHIREHTSSRPGTVPSSRRRGGVPVSRRLPRRNARRANDLIAHIRTHGNFLIARSGLLRRDAMRAVGNVLTGLIYNVSGFVLYAASSSTTLYLAVVTTIAPAMPYWLALFPTVAHSTSVGAAAEVRRNRFGVHAPNSTRSAPRRRRSASRWPRSSTRSGSATGCAATSATVADPVVSVFIDDNERRTEIVKVLVGGLLMGAFGASSRFCSSG